MRDLGRGLYIIVLLMLTFSSLVARVRFKDASYQKKVRGFYYQGGFCYGHGIAFADINHDTLPDMYVSNAMRMDAANLLPELLYISHKGEPYTEKAVARGLDDRYWDTGSHGIVFVDIDNDGDYDVFNGTTDIKNRIYRNDGNGFYSDITDNILYNGETYITRRGTRGVCAFDANGDGYMDLYAVNWRNYRIEDDPEPHELYINNGDGTFTADPESENAHGLTGMDMVRLGEGVQGISAADVDNDGDIDVYLSRRNYGREVYDAHNQLMINDGGGYFTDKTRERGVYYERTPAYFNNSNGSHFADYDNDGDLDLFLANTIKSWKQDMKIFENQGDGHFIDVTDVHKIPQDGFSVLLFDMNNDTDLDMMVLPYSGHADWVAVVVYLNDGNGRFHHVSGTGAEVRVVDPRAGAVADVDDDGDLDVYFVDANKGRDNGYYNHLLVNTTDDGFNWIKVYGRGPKGDMGAFGTKVWVFEAGHMNDMEHLLGYKQIQSTYGYLSQDDPVQHFGLRDRDSCDVKVKLLDGSVFQTRSAPAKIRLYFSKPRTLVKEEGDDQIAPVGSTLQDPLMVSIENQKGIDDNLAGVPLFFQVQSGNGTFVANQQDTLTVYTDLQGKAAVFYTPGTESIEQAVQVSSPMLPEQSLTFHCRLMAEGPAVLQFAKDVQLSGVAGSFVTDSIKYQVQNGYGEGVADHPVTFRIISGNGMLNQNEPDSVIINSNQQGFAAVAWRLGPLVSIVNEMVVESFSEERHLFNSPDTLRLFAGPGEPAGLLKYDGDDQKGFVNQSLNDSLVVTVYDRFNNPVPGATVYFKIKSGGGQVGSDSLYETTANANGLAKCEWTLGPIAGLEQAVQAFLPQEEELFVRFSARAKHPHAFEVICLNNTSFVGNRNTALRDSIVIGVQQQNGHPVQHFAVTVEANDGGAVNHKQSLIQITDENGLIKLEWEFGDKTGEQSLTVHAGSLQNSPLELRASVRSRAPVVLQLLSEENMTTAPDSGICGPINVQVTDSLGYAIFDQAVDFEVLQGDATFKNSKTLTLKSDRHGLVQPVLYTGTTAGQVLIKVSSKHQNTHLMKSPFYISVYIVAQEPSVAHSSITATSPHIANGIDSCRITVTIQDEYDNPVSGLQINLVSDSQHPVVSMKDDSTTNEFGQVVAFCKSVVAGEYNFRPLLQGQPLTSDSAAVIFKAGAPHHLARFSKAEQKGYVCQQLDSVLVFAVVDSCNNPVPHQEIEIQIQLPDSQKSERMQLKSTSDALFYYPWEMSDQTGEHILTVYHQDLQPIFFKTIAELPVPLAIEKISGDQQSGLSNTLLLQPFEVCVKGENDNPLCRIPVRYNIITGNGHFYNGSVDTTDRNGRAQTRFILGNITGEITIHAIAEGLQEPAEFTCTVLPNKVSRLQVVDGDQQQARPGVVLPDSLVVRVWDDQDQPVAGQLIKFVINSGGGQLCSADSAFSDEEGKARCCWELGLQGKQSLLAMVANNESIQTEFGAKFADNTPPTIVCPADTFIQETEVLQFMVKAFDADGDSVLLAIDDLPPKADFDSSKGLFSWQPDYNQQGHYTLIIKAVDTFNDTAWQNLDITVLDNNRLAQITRAIPVDSLIAFAAGDDIHFQVEAEDADGDTLSFYWYVQDSLVHTGKSFILKPKLQTSGEQTIRIEISDGKEIISRTWTLAIQNRVAHAGQVPDRYALMQNYPNPFNPSTVIPFALPKASWITITIYNASGQKIRTMANRFYRQGYQTVMWNGRDGSGIRVPTGTYYYRMQAETFRDSKKMIVVK